MHKRILVLIKHNLAQVVTTSALFLASKQPALAVLCRRFKNLQHHSDESRARLFKPSIFKSAMLILDGGISRGGSHCSEREITAPQCQ
eukprot:8525815-Ditylum_brightwellii.AAC.1